MDQHLNETIQRIVNSRAKFDLLYWFHRNPYACEAITGLAQRLHRLPEDMEEALLDLVHQGLLEARSGSGSGTVYCYCRHAPEAAEVKRLLEAYEGSERKAVLQAISKEDEQTRLRLMARQKSLDDLRTRFVSMVTHELRTPVTVIKSVLKALLHSEALQDGDTRSLTQRAMNQCERLRSVVENLLVLSGMQTGRKLELYLSEVELPRLVREVQARLAEDLPDHDVATDLAEAPETVVADEYLLGQLLEELLRNAMKFSPDGSPVTLAISQPEGMALFVIDDTGPGVSSHQYERVFDPFTQAEEDSSRLTGGMGLGLFMSRKIAESHGGQVWFEPKPPPGTRVCFTVPLEGPVD